MSSEHTHWKINLHDFMVFLATFQVDSHHISNSVVCIHNSNLRLGVFCLPAKPHAMQRTREGRLISLT